MDMIIVIILVAVEVGFIIRQIRKRNYLRKKRLLVTVVEFLSIMFLSLIGGYHFRVWLLLILLLLKGMALGLLILRRSEKIEFRKCKSIIAGTIQICLIGIGVIPILLFPVYKEKSPSGPLKIDTISFTWEDKSRLESFANDGSNRKVTVQFWYPSTPNQETFPLVIFSHGAFGYRMSNYSTYEELVSNGYVVCSIDHTYHAFYTKQTDGKVITVNKDFIKDVYKINGEGITEDEIFSITREWLKLRSDDMNFVLDTIIDKTKRLDQEQVFSEIDISKIGVMGHSLGGATAVSIGRERKDIKAVIDLDGTMLSEELSCKDNVYTINEEPYPVPLLCIDTTKHYEEGLFYGNLYVNNVVLKNAKDAREVHFNEAGHLNFTDLPLFSPFLASLLETGSIDPMSCIQTMNEVILNYYDHYLKQTKDLSIKESY